MRVDTPDKERIGFMSYANFKKLIDDNPLIDRIGLSRSGEIFLNPELSQMIEYAYQNGIGLNADTGANFNQISDECMNALVKYKFNSITIALDGASQETYSQYRRNGNFDKVIANIRRLNEIKRKYSSRLPQLTWQYVLMESNDDEDEMLKAVSMAEELGMRMNWVKTWDYRYRPSPDKLEYINRITNLGLPYLKPVPPEKARAFKPFNFHDDATKDGKLYDKPGNFQTICRQLWDLPFIGFDGRLMGCCNTYHSDFGVNVFEIGLDAALNSKNYVFAKNLISGKVPFEEMPLPDDVNSGSKCTKSECAYKNVPCVHCPRYGYIWQSKDFIKLN